MSPQVDQRHLVQLAAPELRQILAGVVAECKPTVDLSVSGQGRRERFADRSDLEQRIAGDLLPGFPGGHPVVVEALLTISGNCNSQAGNLVLLHDRLGGVLHEVVDIWLFRIRSCGGAEQSRAGKKEKRCAQSSI